MTSKSIKITPYYVEQHKFTDFEKPCDAGHILFTDDCEKEDYYQTQFENWFDDQIKHCSEFFVEYLNCSIEMREQGLYYFERLVNCGNIREENWLDFLAGENPELYKKLDEEEPTINVFGDDFEYIEYKDWIIVINIRS